MLALYIAMSIGLDRPYWAMTTVYIVSHPLTGSLRSKAPFRLIGTVIGAASMVVRVPNLVNAPELLSVALALWTGLCLYLALLGCTPRSYLFILAGYTAALIGFPAVTTPDAVWDIAVARVEEIGRRRRAGAAAGGGRDGQRSGGGGCAERPAHRRQHGRSAARSRCDAAADAYRDRRRPARRRAQFATQAAAGRVQPPRPVLLDAIDRALDAATAMPADRGRDLLLQLVGIRRGLFAGAPPFSPTLPPDDMTADGPTARAAA